MFGSIMPRPRYDDFLFSVEDDDDAGGGGGGGGGNDDDKDKPKPPRTFTQDEVTTIASKEKKDGKRAAVTELLADLGVSSVEDLKALATAAQEAESASLSEAEKARNKAVADAAEAEVAKKEAAQDRRLARVERRLTNAGVPDEKIARALKNLDIDASDEIDDEEVTSAIEDLKKELPSLFEEVEDTGDTGGKPPAVPAPKGKQVKGSSADKARAVLERMHPDLAKKD